MPVYGFAAGLGKLNVNSALGELLKAEIELLAATPEELASISAVVAPEEAYAVQGIPRSAIHSNIKVELSKNASGSPVLKLQSSQPVSDPFLDMLIQVDWSSGRLLREYTILLDPPEYKEAIKQVDASITTINKPVAGLSSADEVPSQPKSIEPEQQSSKPKKSKKTQAKPADAAPVSAEINQAEITTKRGDSLNAIAREVLPEGVSLDQMLVGLYEANKHAFIDGNMNRLKVGQILKVPSSETLVALDRKTASGEVKLHSANWAAYRNNLANNVAATDVSESSEAKQSASGKITTAEDKAAASKTGPQDVVKLSAGATVADKGNKAQADYDAKVLALQEEAIARDKSLKEAQDRTAALEVQIAEMQKLLALKSQAMADLQKNAELKVAPSIETKAVQAEANTKDGKAADKADSNAQQNASAQPVQQQSTAAQSKPQQLTAAANAKKSAKAALAAMDEEPSFLDSLLESFDWMMLSAAGALALIAAAWSYIRNKRRRALDSFERGILTSGGLSANTVFGNTTGNASTSDTSFLTDFAQSADGGMIDTNDVDPIAEAEVYMAYGRDAQAEEILKDAIAKEPKRYELHLKLLEMYASRKDVSAFEAIAGELYTTLGTGDPTWAKVAELGVTLEPENPLYDLSRLPATPVSVEAQHDQIDLGADISPENSSLGDLEKDLDFSLNLTEENEQKESKSAAPADALDTLINLGAELDNQLHQEAADIQSGGSGSAALVKADSEAEPDNSPAEDNSLDFDFSEFNASSTGSQDLSNAAVPAKDEAEQASADLATQQSKSLESTADTALNFDMEQEAAAVPAFTVSTASPEDALAFEGFSHTDQKSDEEHQESDPQLDLSALQGIDLNFEDIGDTHTAVDFGSAKATEAIEMAAASDAAQAIEVVEDEGAASIGAFNLADISLEMQPTENIQPAEPLIAQDAETPPDASAVSAVEVAGTVESATSAEERPVFENPDIDIKLDLVQVYIDMEDIEGARDLLDEVMKEGGANQRKKAQELLASIA